MAHPQQSFFVNGVKQLLPAYFNQRSVLEIGSLNINGSVRETFTDCTYLGLDVGEGPGVDLVCHGENYGGEASSVDVVISCEAMEHNPQWPKTWLNMLRLVKTDGLLIMTCATEGRRQHGTTAFDPTASPLTTGQGQEHYQNLVAADFQALVNHDAWFSVWGFYQDFSSRDLYFFGVGKQASEEVQAQARHLASAFKDHYHRVNVLGLY
ncbi:class I SAM-dependent methyltransferase [Variovorax sp. Root473]|uniref:class I SAM-dependent methyltransferase n=1 Tax=Variovorax sp. Root473 TaxID=1736541 RepID=UPI000B1DD91C|nr:class I SAM-dependent methyltransferase [Variovorax sp. Root473]